MARLELHIEIDPEVSDQGEPRQVRGSVFDENGSETPFVGWLGLIVLLQQTVSTY